MTPRIEGVAQTVAQQIERQHQAEDRQAWPHCHPRRLRQEILRSPARRRRLLAEPKNGDSGGANGKRWYDVNRPSAATPNGFGQEDAIRAIWASDNKGKQPER